MKIKGLIENLDDKLSDVTGEENPQHRVPNQFFAMKESRPNQFQDTAEFNKRLTNTSHQEEEMETISQWICIKQTKT